MDDFQLAEPPLPWKGIRDATKEHDGCYRRHFLTKEITGEENCLYLNVYSKMVNFLKIFNCRVSQ